MDDAVEDGVGDRWHADHLVPAIYRNLAGDDERARVVSILGNLQHVARLVGGERFLSSVIENQQLRARDRAQQPAVAAVAVSDVEIGQRPRHATIEHRDILPTRLVAERAGQPALAEAACPGEQQVAPLGNPVVGGQHQEQGAIEPTRRLVVHVLDTSEMPQTCGARARLEPLLPS